MMGHPSTRNHYPRWRFRVDLIAWLQAGAGVIAWALICGALDGWK